MRGFGACFLAELGDLARHPLAWLAALATAGTAVAAGLSPTTDSANGWLVYEAALSASAQAAGFFLLGIAAGTVASDRTRGTIRWILPRPMARSGYVLGKSAAILLFAIELLLVATLASWAVAAPQSFGDVSREAKQDEAGSGFDFVEEETIPAEYRADAMQGRAVGATLRVLPALWTLAGIGLLVSALIRSAAGAVIAAIGVAAPLHFLPELLGLSEEGARTLPQRAATEAFNHLGTLARGQISPGDLPYSGAAVFGAVLLCVGLPILAALIFQRLDLTD
ncbi:MAG: ABC transporter permease subunit [Planctomycetota bacterium]|jgi:hypothetical protein